MKVTKSKDGHITIDFEYAQLLDTQSKKCVVDVPEGVTFKNLIAKSTTDVTAISVENGGKAEFISVRTGLDLNDLKW